MGNRPAKIRERRRVLQENSAKWLICCEGKSEVIYLTDLIDELARRSGKDASAINIGLQGEACNRGGFQGACGRQHLELLRKAESCSSRFIERVWVVFDYDVDGVPNRDQLYQNFSKTILDAESRGIETAWSIPSFEYWLLSHKSYQDVITPDALSRNLVASLSEAVRTHPLCNKRYQNKAGEAHCSRPTPNVCADRALVKPYYNSFTCLGGIEGLKAASRNSNRCYVSCSTDIQSRKYKSISCCSNIHVLVDALIHYFGFESIDKL